jgi:hypothetical protein
MLDETQERGMGRRDEHMGMLSIFMVRTCWGRSRAVDVRSGRRRREVIMGNGVGGRREAAGSIDREDTYEVSIVT